MSPTSYRQGFSDDGPVKTSHSGSCHIMGTQRHLQQLQCWLQPYPQWLCHSQHRNLHHIEAQGKQETRGAARYRRTSYTTKASLLLSIFLFFPFLPAAGQTRTQRCTYQPNTGKATGRCRGDWWVISHSRAGVYTWNWSTMALSCLFMPCLLPETWAVSCPLYTEGPSVQREGQGIRHRLSPWVLWPG